uniref:Uncharacterized protein n=1 Tax=Monopterus albus TaxID=43700 RepID=A0A3Q3JJG9_MONAL
MQTTSTNICERIGRSQELSELQRGTVIGCHLCNSSREISSLLNIPQSTVSGIITKWKRLGMIATQPRSGRPHKITERGQQMLRRIVHRGHQLSVESILRTVADGLERVHQGTTIGSLTGGVIGAMGGITSIVGLILAPFTLGTSLIVTGVGVGVSTLGGAAAGASNITNMVNQSSDRKAVRSIIKEFEEKINAVVTWLQEIYNSLQEIRNRFESADTIDRNSSENQLARLGLRAGRGLGGISELVRLVQVVNIGRIAAQATRAVRVAETVTGVLSGLFIAVDIFFIAMDAKEIHHIRQAKAAEERTASQPMFVNETEDSVQNMCTHIHKNSFQLIKNIDQFL